MKWGFESDGSVSLDFIYIKKFFKIESVFKGGFCSFYFFRDSLR